MIGIVVHFLLKLPYIHIFDVYFNYGITRYTVLLEYIIMYLYDFSYGGLDVRRKNATRESTSTLKAWLYEHIKNPYPTKGEKIMRAIITKMTLTQVGMQHINVHI